MELKAGFAVLDAIRRLREEQRLAMSTYIADELRRRGYQFSQAVLLRRLRAFEASGFIATDNIHRGLYGFKWELTDKGREWSR